MLVRQYVNALSVEEIKEILFSYEKYEIQGFIGDEPIRVRACEMLVKSNISSDNIIFWMDVLGKECYRYFALRFLNKSIS